MVRGQLDSARSMTGEARGFTPHCGACLQLLGGVAARTQGAVGHQERQAAVLVRVPCQQRRRAQGPHPARLPAAAAVANGGSAHGGNGTAVSKSSSSSGGLAAEKMVLIHRETASGAIRLAN